MFTEQELTNLNLLITAGAKVISQDKPLNESVMIQNTGLQLIEKIKQLSEPERIGPENPENLG